MAIEKVEIQNFTVFEDIDLEFSKGVNMFIGENGTGKTHLIKYLYSYLESMNYKEYGEYGYPVIIGMWKDVFGSTGLLHDIKKMMSCRIIINGTEEYFEGIPVGYTSTNFMLSIKENPSSNIYIPVKDMLTHSKGLLEMSKKYSKDMPFDKTLLDIIEKARQWKLIEIPDIAKNIIPKLENIIDGTIIIENDTFYVQKRNGVKIDFAVEAEGIKKIGLLWQLLMNENITKETVLFWDEPEANINPKLIPDIVEIILELSRQGVQIFIATHDYILAKYMEVKMNDEDDVLFHALYQTSNGVQKETQKKFISLENNSIIKETIRLYKEEVKKVMG